MPFIISFAAILAGLGRAVVGGGWISRGFVYGPTAAFSAYLGFGLTWEALVFAGLAAATLTAGWTKWEDSLFMAARYGVLPMIGALTYTIAYHDPKPIIWAFACVAVGFLYGTMLTLFKRVHVDIKGYVIDANRVAEFIAGSVIIGGLAFL